MIVRISGGLGNQMFQYAFGRKWCLETGDSLYLDTNLYLRDKKRRFALNEYNIKASRLNKAKELLYAVAWKFQRIPLVKDVVDAAFKIEKEKEVLVTQIVNDTKKYFAGEWQNQEYFLDIREQLLLELTYCNPLSVEELKMCNEIKNRNSVAVHIRRGDYLSDGIKNGYRVIEKEFYLSAIAFFRKKIDSPTFYFFSDDIEWCKKEYGIIGNAVFIDKMKSSNDNVDFELMKNCKYFIIANSTFSWWASWLSEFEKKIIVAPRNWFFDAEVNKCMQKALLRDAILM